MIYVMWYMSLLWAAMYPTSLACRCLTQQLSCAADVCSRKFMHSMTELLHRTNDGMRLSMPWDRWKAHLKCKVEERRASGLGIAGSHPPEQG